MEQCEKEVEYGLSFGWQVYAHRPRKVHGCDYSTQNSCAKSGQQFSIWIGRDSARWIIYLVNNTGGRLIAEKQTDYAACMKKVRAVQSGET